MTFRNVAKTGLRDYFEMVQSLQSYLRKSLWLLMKMYAGERWKNGKLCCVLRKQHLNLDFVKLGFVGGGTVYMLMRQLIKMHQIDDAYFI